MKDVPVAADKMRSAQTHKVIGGITSAIGGALIGWSIGTAINKELDTNWTPAIIGAGVCVISIPIQRSGVNKAKEAGRHYQESQPLH